MAKTIDKKDLQIQKEYISRLAADNLNFATKNGRKRKALTETYGCQQNENDTERIRGMLYEAGFEFTEDIYEADLVIYNTCAVRENAEDKVFGRLGILKHIKEEGHDMLIAVCGCMVQQEHITEKIKNVHEHVDLIFGTHSLYKMPSLLYEAMQKKGAIIDIEDNEGAIAEDIPILRDFSQKAWVSVMYGCNNFCSYCIVPYVRGRERSRRPEAVINEVKELVKNGCTEISLLGQNVNSYGKDLEENIDFSDLLKMVNDVEGVERIRFMTSHPKDFGDKLIQTMKECDKVCHQMHLPFQAGSDRILKQMNRGYTKAEYLEKIAKLKEAIPGISLSTDVIVGFPTETNEDFEHTLDVLREVEFDNIFSFIYSRREGTPAAKLDFVLSEDEIHKNFNRLLEVQNEISKRKNEAYVGRCEKVLVDGASKNDPNMLSGRLESSKVVNFRGDESLVGRYVDVIITEARTWSLNGKLKDSEE